MEWQPSHALTCCLGVPFSWQSEGEVTCVGAGGGGVARYAVHFLWPATIDDPRALGAYETRFPSDRENLMPPGLHANKHGFR